MGEAHVWRERTCFDPWLVHFYTNEEFKFAVWLVQIALSWLVGIICPDGHYGATLVSKDGNEDIAAQLQLEGAHLSPLIEIQFQELFYKGWFKLQDHNAGGLVAQFVAFLWNADCVSGYL